MKTFKEYIELLNEMPVISLRGKGKDSAVYADEEKLKEVDVEKLDDNIVFFRQDTPSFLPEGSTWVYFMDSEESAKDMKAGKIPMLMVPQGTFMSGGSPITDVWSRRFAKAGTEHILGMIEGNTNEDTIYINMMTVRPKYKRNTINTKMIQFLQKQFPKAKVQFSSPTDQGKKFIEKMYPTK